LWSFGEGGNGSFMKLSYFCPMKKLTIPVREDTTPLEDALDVS
jgi:hypothetical protein